MKYNLIRKMDISNGPGVRVSVFMQGCEFHCKNCFNSNTWSFDDGEDFTETTIDKVLELCKPDYIKGLSILGGEPMHPRNIEATTKLAKAFKEKYPNKSIWLYTGGMWEDVKQMQLMEYLDVLVDGEFVVEKKDVNLHWVGSSNQRVINVPETLEKGKIIYHES